MPVIRMGSNGTYRGVSTLGIKSLWPEDLMDQAAMQSVDTVPLPPSVDQMLGAPAPVHTPDPIQVVKDKLLSVMTEEDIVVFKDMMRRMQSVMTPSDMLIMSSMASSAIEQQVEQMASDEDSTVPYASWSNPLIAQPGAGMGGHSWRSAGSGQRVPVIQLLDETDDEEEDEGIHPGYNTVTKEDAVGMVARWLDANDKPVQPGCTVEFDDMENMVDGSSSDGFLRRSLTKGGYSIMARSNGMDSITAMLAGAPTTHYLYYDGRIQYEITAQDISAWRLERVDILVRAGTRTKQRAVMQAHANGGYVQATGNYLSGYISSDAYFGERRLSDKHVQTITGPSYAEVQEELAAKRAAKARVDQLLNSPNIKIEARPKRAPVNPLTGAPQIPPQPAIADMLITSPAMTEEILVTLANEAKHPVTVGLGNGLKMTASPAALPPAPPKPTTTATYTPPVPVDESMSFADLIAEVKRTFDFCASNWHPFDSKMSGLCLGVLDVFDNYTPRTMEEVKEAHDLCINTLRPIHQVLAVSVPRNPSLAAQQYMSSAATGTVTVSNGAHSTHSAVGTSNINVILNGFTGANSPPAVDRAWKLEPGHVYHLEDGSRIEIDATGNYTIHDKDAHITYRASRVREFNRFVNGSDLVADFLETLAKMGTTQEQAAKAPLEMFIRWLIFKAAEQDHDEAPTDVAPITASEVQQLVGAT